MNKRLTQTLFIFLFTIMGIQPIKAQTAVCVDGLTASLNAFGELTLWPEDIDNGSFDYTSLSIDQTFFDCDDIGDHIITLTATDGNGNTATCQTTVTIEDQAAPVAICDVNVIVQLDENNTHVLDPEVLDDGSYDACGPVSLTVSPEVIDCSMPNPFNATLMVTDQSGNVNVCIVQVTYLENVEATPNLACNDGTEVLIFNGESVEITADMILEGGPYYCPAHYSVNLTYQGNDQMTNIVTPDDIGKTFVVTVTDPETGNACWGSLTVAGGDCPNPFLICDTACADAPLTDCDGGHTDTDNVEWPCDLTIANCGEFDGQPFPGVLIDLGYSEAEVYPQIVEEPCHLVGIAFADQVFINPLGYKIIRTWTVIEWVSETVGEYDQVIIVESSPLVICDSLPWNAPVGDCASGHTLDDDVEWPDDITVMTTQVLPLQLANNPNVDSQNVQPQVQNICNQGEVSYTDLVTIFGDSLAIIVRTWTISDSAIGNSWTYNQKITILADLTNLTACANRSNGNDIPDVEMMPGVFTGENGCADLDAPQGYQITPDKVGDISEGVDIFDKVLMMEHVLGITQLGPYEILAADLNGDGIVTTVDVVLIEDILEGNSAINDVWSFYDASFQFANPLDPFTNPAPQSIEVSAIQPGYNFIGVKKADLDNSFVLNAVSDPHQVAELFVMDEILNNGETYETFLFSDKTLALQGIQLELSTSSEKFEFLNLSSETLPGFNMEEHVSLIGNRLIIKYAIPLEVLLSGGLKIDPEEPIIKFGIKAVANGILSQEFSLNSDAEHFMKVSAFNEKFDIKLGWDQTIVSSIRRNELQGVSMFPNPAVENVTIRLDVQGVQDLDYSIFDMNGRQLKGGILENLRDQDIDISELQEGIYILRIMNQTGQRTSHRLVVQR